MHRSLVPLVVVLAAFTFAACGGDDTPTSVDEADLEQDGEFWNSLTPDLKEDLVEYGQTQLGEERPDGASTIEAVDNDELISEIDDTYSNESNLDRDIIQVYTTANDELAAERLDELVPLLEQGP